jgi:hypothetical protein
MEYRVAFALGRGTASGPLRLAVAARDCRRFPFISRAWSVDRFGEARHVQPLDSIGLRVSNLAGRERAELTRRLATQGDYDRKRLQFGISRLSLTPQGSEIMAIARGPAWRQAAASFITARTRHYASVFLTIAALPFAGRVNLGGHSPKSAKTVSRLHQGKNAFDIVFV